MSETLYFTGQVSQAPLSFTGDGQASQIVATGSVAAAGPQGTTGATGATGATGPASAWGTIPGTLSAQTDLQTALNAKESTITAGTSAQYYRGDKSMQTLNQDAVPSGTTNKTYTATEQTKLAAISGTNTGDETLATIKTKLGITTLSGSNTGDQDLSSYATTSSVTTGLAAKQATLVSGTTIKTVNGTTLLGSGDLVIAGGGTDTTKVLKTGDTLTGNLGFPLATKTTTYTQTVNDVLLLADATSAGFTITLADATTVSSGASYYIKKLDTSANEVILLPSGSQTIDGAPYQVLSGANNSVTLVSDGTNWWLF